MIAAAVVLCGLWYTRHSADTEEAHHREAAALENKIAATFTVAERPPAAVVRLALLDPSTGDVSFLAVPSTRVHSYSEDGGTVTVVLQDADRLSECYVVRYVETDAARVTPSACAAVTVEGLG